MEIGKKTWVFSDGDLPPHGDSEPFGHEALMIVNNGEKDATIKVTILFDEPVRAVTAGQAAVIYDGDTVLGGGVIQ